MSNICPYFPRCKACTAWDQPYPDQKAKKIRNLHDLLRANKLQYEKEIEFISLGDQQLRHRADFSMRYNEETEKFEFGFYQEDKTILPITACLQFSPELQKVYNEFINFNPETKTKKIKKASVRLRVSPSGGKACWLDLANLDVKDLLEDKQYLSQLLEHGFTVEVGQKAKTVRNIDGKLKLSEPKPEIWFKTYDNTLLFCSVSDFTQPSWHTGSELVRIALNWLRQNQNVSHILEFGAGIGMFTVPFLKNEYKVTALEIEPEAVNSLKISAADYFNKKALEIHCHDFHRKDLQIKADAAFVNPARSGLKGFAHTLLKSEPTLIIYVSCFAESMLNDLSVLSEKYEIADIKIVDQFPQTDHYESCVLLKKFK